MAHILSYPFLSLPAYYRRKIYFTLPRYPCHLLHMSHVTLATCLLHSLVSFSHTVFTCTDLRYRWSNSALMRSHLLHAHLNFSHADLSSLWSHLFSFIRSILQFVALIQTVLFHRNWLYVFNERWWLILVLLSSRQKSILSYSIFLSTLVSLMLQNPWRHL